MTKVFQNIFRQWKGALMSYHKRLIRFGTLLIYPIPRFRPHYLIQIRSLPDALAHFVFLIGDLIFIPEISSSIACILKPSTRLLLPGEVDLIRSIYGENIDLSLVLVDPKSRWFTRGKHIAYVAFQTINFWESIEEAILIHECFHILQFQRLGSVYIYESIKAQRSEQGYDYGGPQALEQGMMLGMYLEDYNFEQQAEIIEDAFRMVTDHQILPFYYTYFLHQLDVYMVQKKWPKKTNS